MHRVVGRGSIGPMVVNAIPDSPSSRDLIIVRRVFGVVW
jgi:hypothetical protein